MTNTNRRNKYAVNPEPERARSNKAYHAYPSPIRKLVLESYYVHPSPIKWRTNEAYRVDPSPVKQCALCSYYKDHKNAKQRYREKHHMLRQNLMDYQSLQRLVAYSVTKKYNKLWNSARTSMTTYIYKLIKNVSKYEVPLKQVLRPNI